MEVFVRVTESETSLDMLDAFCTLFNHESPCSYIIPVAENFRGKGFIYSNGNTIKVSLFFLERWKENVFMAIKMNSCFMFFLFILVGFLIQ